MRSNLDVARLLLRKAESDLADVRRTLASQGPYDTALFHESSLFSVEILKRPLS